MSGMKKVGIKMNKPEEVRKPMTFEIHANKLGKPYLKKVERRRNIQEEGRGSWMPVGRVTDTGIEKVVRINQKVGKLLCLPDEDGVFRVLVLTD
jgi:hypothetical protein